MIYFIVNTSSQSGKAGRIWREIRNELMDKNVSFKAYRTRKPKDATAIAEKISRNPEKDKMLIVVGGDGTINEVLNGITDFENIKFACISSGSGNDFARGLNITGSPRQQIRHILESGITQSIDLGKVTYKDEEGYKSRIFGISSGIGMDAIVCKKALTSRQKKLLNKIGLGKLTYVLLTVETLFSMTTSRAKVGIVGEDYSLETDNVIFMAAMNMRAEGGGVPMAPTADYADGRLNLCMAHSIPKWRTFFCLPFLVAARHEKLKGFELIEGKKIAVSTDRPVV
ncbi:MAG: diacylglycerol/lipid kinase family protein [Lachnospiraceae bacterium]